MSLTTVDFFRLTGGFRMGETQEELKRRIAEIVRLEASLSAGVTDNKDAEYIRSRLRQLRDVDIGVTH
jgi:hypothetical protein